MPLSAAIKARLNNLLGFPPKGSFKLGDHLDTLEASAGVAPAYGEIYHAADNLAVTLVTTYANIAGLNTAGEKTDAVTLNAAAGTIVLPAGTYLLSASVPRLITAEVSWEAYFGFGVGGEVLLAPKTKNSGGDGVSLTDVSITRIYKSADPFTLSLMAAGNVGGGGFAATLVFPLLSAVRIGA